MHEAAMKPPRRGETMPEAGEQGRLAAAADRAMDSVQPRKAKAPNVLQAGASIESVAYFANAAADRFTLDELSRKPPAVSMAAAPYVPRGVVSELIGPGGVGKGQLIAALIAAKATGGSFCGHPLEPERVIFWTAEDSREQVLRSLHPVVLGLSDADRQILADNLIVKSTVGADVKITRRQDGAALVAGDVDVFITYARGVPGLGLVVLDTLSRLNGIDETNEGLALAVQAAERIAVALDCGVLLTHHTGKGQMRAGVNDQYIGRGGSAASDNARSVLSLARITVDDHDAPTNAAELIKDGRLLRLSHVKSNYVAAAADVFLERVIGPAGPWLRLFRAAWDVAAATATTWTRIAEYLRVCGLAHPTATTIDDLPTREFGSRSARRAAVSWALDHGHLRELPHPVPRGRRSTFLQLVDETDA
jgi:hypothetical protein